MRSISGVARAITSGLRWWTKSNIGLRKERQQKQIRHIRASSVRLAPVACQIAPLNKNTDPLGAQRRTSSGWRRDRGSSLDGGFFKNRWLPGTNRVPPFSGVKSFKSHKLLTNIGNAGRGSGIWLKALST